MSKKQDSFSKIQNLSKNITLLSSIYMLLEWDLETYMPEEAIDARSDQMELLATLIHKQKTAPAFKKALSNLIDLSTGSMVQENTSLTEQAAAREWRREYLQEAKLPSSFVKQFAKITAKALPAWADSKKNANFASFAPHLEKIVTLSKKKAKLLGFEEHPYDALLDLYEPGLTVKTLTPLFAELKVFLIELLKEIQKNKKPIPLIKGLFSQEKQMQVGATLLKVMGFCTKASRLDISSHPFCTAVHPKDTRMTTRIDFNSPISSLSSVIHEAGHGLYHRNLPIEHYGTPLCEAASYGVDESQSRLWETIIGKSPAFCKFIYPKLQEVFPENLSNLSLEEYYQALNHVEASEIRVEADEVTYSLHIILRFEIEKALMEGSLSIKDVPKVWNQKMQESLGITPSSDKTGCLQDIHWAMGGIGYFPTYALGNLLAAQLFSTFEKSHLDWEEKIANGNLLFLEEWLKENIHKHGKIYTPSELITKATGKPLSAKPYMHYLKTKYSKLYS